MNVIRLLVATMFLVLWSCETLNHKGEKGADEKPESLADIDVSDLPPEYVPNLKPVVAYYVDNPANSQFTFEDQIGDYRVMLFPDHRYRFVATAKDKSKSTSREGLWKWHRVGPDQGFLMLDNRRWFIGFTTLDEAEANTQGDTRAHRLKFSHM